MTFDEWLIDSDHREILLLTEVEVHVIAMRAAWQAGYEQGYKECATGVKPTPTEMTHEEVVVQINPRL